MKLIVKHTQGKLPFIGVLFSTQEEAIGKFPLIHESILMYANQNYGRISLSLKTKNNQEVIKYRLIEYDHKEYSAWRAYIHLGVNFGHCYLEKQESRIAKLKTGEYCFFKLIGFHES